MYFSLMVHTRARRLCRADDDNRINVDEYLTLFRAKLLVFFNVAMDLLGYKIPGQNYPNPYFVHVVIPTTLHTMWFKYGTV